MWPARFAESANQRRIRGFKKPQRNRQSCVFFQFLIDGGKFAQRLAFADIDDHRRFGRLTLRLYDEFVEFAQQTEREIIDAEKTPVLERPEEGSLSRPAHPGNDDERR